MFRDVGLPDALAWDRDTRFASGFGTARVSGCTRRCSASGRLTVLIFMLTNAAQGRHRSSGDRDLAVPACPATSRLPLP